MESIIFILAIATFCATLAGGIIILKFKKHLHYFFAFGAGSLVAVSFLDILPESIELAKSISLPINYLMLTIVIAFFAYSLLEKFFTTHDICHGDECKGHIMGPIGAWSLVVHSFLDGVAIGSAFQVNPAVGFIVAFAVLMHKFTDGVNIVTVMLKNKQKVRDAAFILLCGAIAPVAGILLTLSLAIPAYLLAIILVAFVGEFLYIGASTLLPEIQKHSSRRIMIVMALGIIVIAVLTALI